MKNLHLIESNKISKKGDIVVLNGLKIWDGIGEPPHHNLNIYITNDEEIKEDWFLGVNNIVYKFNSDDVKNGFKPKGKKIILTDNKDLIADGVQAIDDDFFEWFVKNPSCEKVDVKVEFIQTPDNLKYGFYYKIIIPKEEPKQETLEEAAERLMPKTVISEQGKTIWRLAFEESAKWQAERMYSEGEARRLCSTLFKTIFRIIR